MTERKATAKTETKATANTGVLRYAFLLNAPLRMTAERGRRLQGV
jgi:hypothetical protein